MQRLGPLADERLALPGEGQLDHAAVLVGNAPGDQPLVLQPADDLGDVRPLDHQLGGEHALADAGIVADHHQDGELAGPHAVRTERLEIVLEHAQLGEPHEEAERLPQITQVDVARRRLPFEGGGHQASPWGTSSRLARFSRKARRRSSASGLVAVKAEMNDSTNRPSSFAMSWIRGSAWMTA